MEMEEAARKTEGVSFVSVNFLSMKLTLEAEDSVFPQVFKKVEKVCRAVEPDVRFYENKFRLQKEQKGDVFQILISILFFVLAKVAESWNPFSLSPAFSALFYLPAYLIAGFNVIRKAFSGILHLRWFDENFLMTLATFGAFALREASEAVMVMILYQIGEFFQEMAVSKSRRNVSELMDLRPDHANWLSDGTLTTVSPEKVPIGAEIMIKPGEKVPLDGIVLNGSSFLDCSALTGESLPRPVTVGDFVLSGSINLNGVLTVQTEKSFEESSASKILSLIESSESKKSGTERIITRFARYYTPIVVFLALFLALVPPLFLGNLSLWVEKAITCLVISCPCALVISVPLSFFGGIGAAGANGILIKGAQTLENLAKAKTCAFDKTGTLTKGSFQVTAIHPEQICEEELLELAATCEHYSDHPISQSLKNAYQKDIDQSRIGKIEEFPGSGVIGIIDGKEYFVGNETLMKNKGITIPLCPKCHHNQTVVHIASEHDYLGHIAISDQIRSDSPETIQVLKQFGIKNLHLISGDRKETAELVGQELGIETIHAQLLPQDKLEIVKELQKEDENRPVIFVGDGVNDTPVLSVADIGIAMGGIGVDAAIEAADAVLIDDKPSKVTLAIRIARKTLRIVKQNIILSIGVKLLVLIPNLFLGEESIPIFLAIFADVGMCLIAVLNATRALRIKK